MSTFLVEAIARDRRDRDIARAERHRLVAPERRRRRRRTLLRLLLASVP